MEKNKKLEDTYSYKGWLNSDSFWKRVWAIYGYGVVATAIIYLSVLIFLFLIALFFDL